LANEKKEKEYCGLLAEVPGVAGTWRHGRRNEEELAGVAFGAGEVNWWSGKEEQKKHNKPAKPGNIPCFRLFLY